MSATTASAVQVGANPYVGPRPLRFGETLHGRTRELDQLCDAVVADRVVLLYSPSGAGKSSLLEAGLRPALTAKGFFVAPTIRVNLDTPGNRYATSALLSLNEALPADRGQDPDALAAITLADYVSSESVASLHREAELCLIFDQFEEVFTLDPVDIAVKTEFFEQLGELLRDRGVWSVIAMREDYIAQLDPYLAVFPRRLATRQRLDFLDERAALAAVRSPAAAMGVQFTDEAAELLVSDLQSVMVTRGGAITLQRGLYVEPVQLQVVCSQLWSRLPDGTSTVTKTGVEQYADTDNALTQFYSDQVAAVASQTGESERLIRDWFELRLITPQGFRAQTFDYPSKRSPEVLKALEDSYLIRAEDRRGVQWYELTHDRMIAPVIEGNAEWREARLSPLQKRAAEWETSKRPEGMLVGGDVLTEAEAWISQSPDATDVERAFVEAARHHEDDAETELKRRADEAKRARRRSFIFATLAILAIAGLIAAVIATSEARQATSKAEDSACEAEARDLAARSNAADDPYERALLALEGEVWTESPVLQTRIAWHDAVDGIGRQPLHRSHAVVDTGDVDTSAVAWNPAGTQIATGNYDGTLRLFDAATMEVVGEDANIGSVNAVAWNPAGTQIATGGGQSLILLDATTLEPIGEPVRTGDNETSAVAWNPAGSRIATGNFVGTMQLFDASSLAPIGHADAGESFGVNAVAWNPAGTQIATGYYEGTMQLFDATTQAPIGDPLLTGDDETTAVAWNPAGTQIATGNYDGTMQLFDATTLEPIGDPVLTGDDATSAVAWNPAGTQIATGNTDGTMQLFDATTWAPIGDPVRTGDDATSAVAWNPAGTQIATGNTDGTMRLFDVTTETSIPERVDTGDADTTAVAWNPAGTQIATGNYDGTMRLFDAATLASLGDPVRTGDDATSAVAWNPAGTQIATGNYDGTMRLFDATTLAAIGDPVNTIDDPYGVLAVAWNPAGTQIATGSGDTLRLFDAVTLAAIGDPVDTGTDDTSALAWNPDGTQIAIGNFDNTLQLYDATSLAPIGDPVDTGGEGITALEWNLVGTQIATGNIDGTLQLFDATTLAAIGDPVRTGNDETSAVAWNPAGTQIATGNFKGTLRLFDAATLAPIGDPVDTGGDGIAAMEWHPAGTQIAIGNNDGTLRLFYVWTESAACTYLRTIMTAEEMDALVGIEGARSKCAHDQVDDLPPIPVLDHPLP